MVKSVTTMSQFYSFCGKLIESHISESGQFPAIVHIAHFTYEKGDAKYDGKDWYFRLDA